MIDLVNTAMLQLQAALQARSLYPEDHPRIHAGERRAAELFGSLLVERAQITVFALGDRVIFEDQVLPGSGSLGEAFFRTLRQSGVDRLTVRRGIDAAELRSFLDALGQADLGAERRLRPGPHLAFGFIEQEPLHAEVVPCLPEPESIPLPGQLAGVLEQVWNGIDGSRRLDGETLGDVITSISQALSNSVDTLLPLAPLKQHDEYTFVHTINVALLSTALGEAVGFDGRDAHDLSMAALLHDVGKQIIPTELLNKSGRFTEEEFRLVQLHPVEGARMLLSTPGVPELAPIVAYEHHMRADGSGYPKLSRGWRLSLASRIVQVADVFDALRTHRPYRPALPLPEILSVMGKDAGVFFDADLLEIFFRRVVSLRLPEVAEFAV